MVQVVAALYTFVQLENFKDLRHPLLKIMLEKRIKGTLILAKEGINGTVCGPEKGIMELIAWLKKDVRLCDIDPVFSFTENNIFYRTKVKLKKEIVTMGVDDINTIQGTGIHVEPDQWNELISSPDVLLIDTRNIYETSIGTFQGAVDPETETFREFPQYVEKNLDPSVHNKVAMFCTGGIRCEKSTSYLKKKGFKEVYQLKGGILNYIANIPKEKSLWQGECFVFDQRVAVKHGVKKGHYDQCYACRMPITSKQKESSFYKKGVSCPYCYKKTTDKQRARFEEREKQIKLALQRNQLHIGYNKYKMFI